VVVQAGVRLGEHFRESCLLPGVMRKPPRPPLGLEELLVPVHASVEVGDGQTDVVHPGNDRADWSVHILEGNKTVLLSSETDWNSFFTGLR